MIIVIDGPAGSGKSSTAKAVAEALNIEYLDSGALYRAVTLLFIRVNQNKDDLFDLLDQTSFSFSYVDHTFHVSIDGNDVTGQLRNREVSISVSEVASYPRIRSFVNDLMRQAVQKGHYIAEGRDLGTAVFPDADLKFFMLADPAERARRRYAELEEKGMDITLSEVRRNIEHRDKKDTGRKADPLKKAEDAIEIDTTKMSFEQQVHHICSIIDEKTELTYKP